MRLSTRGRYSTRAMLDLAQHFGEGPIATREISRRQEVSERYLDQVLAPLKTAGLVRAVRGARGGFELARAPSEIRLAEIIEVTEGSTAPVECVDDPGICPRSESCLTRGVWAEMKKAADSILQSTTLQDLIERKTETRRQAN